MKTTVEHNCDDVKFRLIPKVFWVPLAAEDRADLNLDRFTHYEVAAVSWLGVEVAGFILRERKI